MNNALFNALFVQAENLIDMLHLNVSQTLGNFFAATWLTVLKFDAWCSN